MASGKGSYSFENINHAYSKASKRGLRKFFAELTYLRRLWNNGINAAGKIDATTGR